MGNPKGNKGSGKSGLVSYDNDVVELDSSTAAVENNKQSETGDQSNGNIATKLGSTSTSNDNKKVDYGSDKKKVGADDLLHAKRLGNEKQTGATSAPPNPSPGQKKHGKNGVGVTSSPHGNVATNTNLIQDEASLAESSVPAPGQLDRQRANLIMSQPGALAIGNGSGGGIAGDFDESATLNTNESTMAIPPPPPTAFGAEVVTSDEDFEKQVQQRLKQRTVDALAVQRVTKNDYRGKESSTCTNKIMFYGVVAVIVLIVGVFIGVRSDSNYGDEDLLGGSPATSSPTAPDDPTVTRYTYAMNLFQPIVQFEGLLLTESTPQHKAMNWLLNEDMNNTLDTLISGSTVNDDELNDLQLHLIERFIMAVLYYEFDGPNWVVDYGFLNSTTGVCDWGEEDQGTKCGDDNGGHVALISLEFNNLNGTIPYEIGALEKLQSISLVDTGIFGTLPPTMGNLTNLKLFQLGLTAVSGSIPESIMNMQSLNRLWMPWNALSGQVPTSVMSKLKDLAFLGLWGNMLTGPLPSFNPQIQDLRDIEINDNMFTGTIPESIYDMTSMEILDLNSNLDLAGSISTKIGQLTDLWKLNLNSNFLNGTLCSEFGSVTKLELTLLDNNKLSGNIPCTLSLLDRLGYLQLQNNALEGTVPTELSSLSNLAALNLENNMLTGDLDMFCVDQPALLTPIGSDCYGENPRINCTCCTECCGGQGLETGIKTALSPLEDKMCVTQFDSICKLSGLSYTAETGTYYVENTGTVCDCVGTGADTISTCKDTTCQSCNREGTVCSINEQYNTRFDADGNLVYYNVTFQYVKGRNDTVVFEVTPVDWQCNVTVNDQQCNSCRLEGCGEGFLGFQGYSVSCDNVINESTDFHGGNAGGSFSLCGEERDDYDSPLTVFAVQDPVFRDGCPPRIWGRQNT